MDIKCTFCGAEIQMGDSAMTASCPFCGSSSVVERPVTDVPPPGFAIGFALNREEAIAFVRNWLKKSRNFLQIDVGFVEEVIERDLKGIYLPAYMLGASGKTSYRASIGENYQETETYTDSNGHTQTRRVTKTEWRTLTGNLTEYLPDILVTASKGVQNSVLEAIEPYDYTALRRFDARLLSGWLSEIPTLPREKIIELAQNEAREKIGARLKRFMPGDRVGNVEFQTSFDDVSLDLIQVPIWSLRVPRPNKKDAQPIHLLINGQTGKCGGKIPYSGWRIALFVIVLLGVVAGAVAFLSEL